MEREPLVLRMMVVAFLTGLVHYLDLGEWDTDSIEMAATVVLLAVGTWRARRKVTPVADPRGISPGFRRP